MKLIRWILRHTVCRWRGHQFTETFLPSWYSVKGELITTVRQLHRCDRCGELNPDRYTNDRFFNEQGEERTKEESRLRIS